MNNDNKNFEIEFLQDIWVPLLISLRKDKFIKVYDFPFAFCSLKEKISKFNIDYLISDGLIFDCHIPIPEGKLLIGSIQILPFYDYLYLRINEEGENKREIVFENIYFNINRSLKESYNNAENNLNYQLNNVKKDYKIRKIEDINNNDINTIESDYNNNLTTDNIIKNNDIKEINNETNNETINNNKNEENERNDQDVETTETIIINENKKNDTNKNENNTVIQNILVNYFIIGSEKKIYCPDKPIFIVKDSNTGIVLYSSNNNDYTFMLKGFLTNGLQEKENNYLSIVETYEDISFSLYVLDNLAEDEDNQKAQVNCSIPLGTLFYTNINIFCHGEKISEESKKTNNTDITLNWGIEKNKIHEDIIIQWPSDKKKIKHMYSYYIKGFSLLQTNYGCFNNEFYFYIYIYKLEHETDINFEIKMKNPVEPKAICKLYESSIIKCYFPLHQTKLEKFTIIDLPTNYTYYSIDEKGNKVIFSVDSYDYDYEDFHLKVKEDCGDYFIVGALKKAGLDYFKIFLIIIGIAAFVFIVFVCFICFIYYKIKYRNRKGIYIRHIEEDINTNTNTNKGVMKEKKIEIISSRSIDK